MSRENVELVKSLQPTGVDLVEFFSEDALQAQLGDRDLALFFDPDFKVQFSTGVPGYQVREYSGRDGFVEGWRDWLGPWASFRIDVEEFIDAGDDVVVFARMRCVTARDGVHMDHTPAAVWTIRQGKVVAIRHYLYRNEALKAAGLSEQDALSN